MMIASIDGRIEVDGLSGPLGAPADHQRFVAMRRHADAIIVGATTARVEDYRPSDTLIAVVTARLSLDPTARLFGDVERQPLLYTTSQAAGTRAADFAGISEVCALGDSVSAAGVLADLGRRGCSHVVLEGGPTLNSLFLEADLVDELLLSTSPNVAGGPPTSITSAAPLSATRPFSIDRVLLGDGLVFTRWLRPRTSTP